MKYGLKKEVKPESRGKCKSERPCPYEAMDENHKCKKFGWCFFKAHLYPAEGYKR